MKNFFRALRYAYPYRRRLTLSIVCALFAAILWGLNFTAIYPVLKLLSTNQSLQEWAQGCIQSLQKEIDGDKDHPEPDKQKGLQEKQDRLSQEAEQIRMLKDSPFKDRESRRITAELLKAEGKLESARRQVYYYSVLYKYIDQFMPTDVYQTLIVVLILVIVGVAIKGVFEFLQESLVGSVVNLSLFDLRNRFYRNVIHLDVDQLNQQSTSELMARFTNDMELLGAGKKTLFGKVIAEPLRALSCVILACLISWQLTLLFLILVPVALYILTRVGRMMKRATHRLLERMSAIYKILQESLQGIRVVKAYTMEPYERRRFCTATKDYYDRSMMVVKLDALTGPLIELMGVLAVAGALLAGAWLVLKNDTHLFGMRMTDHPMEAETLLQFYVLLIAIADPVRKLSSVYTRLQSGAAAADRIFAFLDKQPNVQNNCDGPRLPRHDTSIEFRDVSFSYVREKPILTNVNLTVRAGEIIAVVGKNGCGKTTLLGLLPRFYDPDHGTILIDGHDIRCVNLRSLRSQIGVVTQDPILFDDSVYNNIAYGS